MVFLNVSRDTFFIYKNWMRICGTWPMDQRKSVSLIVYTAFAFFEIAILLYLVEFLRRCAVYDVSHVEVTGNAVYIGTAAIMRLTLRLHGSRMIPIIESTIDDWALITDPIERTIMKSHDKLGTIYFFILLTRGTTYYLVYDFISFAFPNAIVQLDYRLSCTGNDETSARIILFLNVVICSFENLSLASGILLFWSLGLHLCGQYQILKKRFNEFLLTKENKERRDGIRRLVERHSQLIDLSQKLEDSFSIYLAQVLFVSQLLLCFQASRLGSTIKDTNIEETSQLLLNIFIVLLTLFPFFYLGEYLVSCGEEIGKAIMQCNWYNLRKESMADVSIIVARTRMPISLTAAKLYKLNHSSFRNMLDAVYSYISLIVSITEK